MATPSTAEVKTCSPHCKIVSFQDQGTKSVREVILFSFSTLRVACVVLACVLSSPAYAAVNIPITVNLSEAVTVTGTPQIAVDVGGTTRQANYTSGTGTNALTFTLAPQAGDVDLDGVTVSSPIQLNGGKMSG